MEEEAEERVLSSEGSAEIWQSSDPLRRPSVTGPPCDASPYGHGAVLSHQMPNGEEKPVGFASRTLTKAETNYSHLDKEGLAIIFGVKKFHQYLHGRQFEIKTNHKPLTHIFHEIRATPTLVASRGGPSFWVGTTTRYTIKKA